MPRTPKGIQMTPTWKGDMIAIHVDGQIVNVAAPDDGVHFAVPSACHFFVDARTLWDHLDTVVEGPRKPKKLL